MPIEQFHYRRPVNGMAEGVKPVASAWGTRVHDTDRVGSAGTNVQPAGLFSTAPYIDPDGVEHLSPAIISKTTRQCEVIRVDGDRCKRMVEDGGELCNWHRAHLKKE